MGCGDDEVDELRRTSGTPDVVVLEGGVLIVSWQLPLTVTVD